MPGIWEWLAKLGKSVSDILTIRTMLGMVMGKMCIQVDVDLIHDEYHYAELFTPEELYGTQNMVRGTRPERGKEFDLP